MSRFHHHSNVLNNMKIVFLCLCSSSSCSLDIAQERGTKLHFLIAFSIERSRNSACFCAFWYLLFENQSIFGHNINRLFYSCGLLIAFFQILWAIIGWKTFLVTFFSGHWNLTARFICDVIMAKIIGRAIAWLRKQSWPLPPDPDPGKAGSGNEIGAPHTKSDFRHVEFLRLEWYLRATYGSSSEKLVISFSPDHRFRIRKFGTRRRKSCGKVRSFSALTPITFLCRNSASTMKRLFSEYSQLSKRTLLVSDRLP